jgi:DNA-binding response OmpR family regulator
MKNILIVEDDADFANLIAFNLKKLGYEVRLAYNALMGFNIILSNKPDLVLLDINLPSGSGIMLAERIHNTPQLLASTNIIFITSQGDQTMRDIATKLGAKAFFQKPFEMNDLVKSISDLFSEVEIK